MKDEQGNRYGRLLVISRDDQIRKSPQIHWLCRCSCGNELVVHGGNLRSGNTKSCGCYKIARISKARTTHGRSGTVEMNAFEGMHKRCLSRKNPKYPRYGGRGITICDRWHRDTPGAFENFLADMGERPSTKHSIDRDNNDGPYSPENCRWATQAEQQNNKKNNVTVTIGGRSQTVAQWSRELSIPKSTIHNRLYRGLSDAQALGLEE